MSALLTIPGPAAVALRRARGAPTGLDESRKEDEVHLAGLAPGAPRTGTAPGVVFVHIEDEKASPILVVCPGSSRRIGRLVMGRRLLAGAAPCSE